MTTSSPLCILLLSGGLDSATTFAMAREEGYRICALSFDYGQRHSCEINAAKKIAASLGAEEHLIAHIDLSIFGGSALTDHTIAVPKSSDHEANACANTRPSFDKNTSIPVTYVPARNTIFLSYALACAESHGAFDIFIGANAVDYSGYPDCRPEYLSAFESMANLATKDAVQGRGKYRIHRPLLTMTKAQIIERGTLLGINYADTISCYDADDNGLACGECDSCHLRKQGFTDAGLTDVTRYR